MGLILLAEFAAEFPGLELVQVPQAASAVASMPKRKISVIRPTGLEDAAEQRSR